MANKKKLSKKLIKNIVSLIESGETSISKICSLTGISRSAWYKWEAGENTQFAVRLSRARTRRKAIEDEKMVCESKFQRKSSPSTNKNCGKSARNASTNFKLLKRPPC